MKIILASASERRAELIKRLIDKYDIVTSNFDENSIDFTGDFGEYVKNISRGKAYSVLDQVGKECIIIACDTIVAFENKVLGKPIDKQHAISMLKTLSENIHNVYSGITILNTYSGKVISEYEKTEVQFGKLSEKDILRYVASGEPMDKAGAYGIQGYGGVFVERINGCYYNVVGLPLNKLKLMLDKMEVTPWK